MSRPLGWDPDWGPDELESALNTAGDNLHAFLLLRSSLAKKYLAYSSGGPQQGWVGKEYNNWARQFNESQFMMGKYVNQLYGRAVDAHNAAVTEQHKNEVNHTPSWVRYKGFGTGLLPYYGYADRVTWDKAPVNTDPNNAEGADPECLAQYSSKTTGANDYKFRAFFSGALASAAAALPQEDNAPSPGGNPSASALARAISYFLFYQVLELDGRVGMIGTAFKEAGNSGNKQFVTVQSQQKLDQQIGADEAPDAKNLAHYASKYGIDNHVLQQLKIHQNDPYYTSAFFNNLNKAQFQSLLTHITRDSNPADQQALVGALVSAYADPNFKKSYQDMVANWLTNTTDTQQADVESDFLMQLQGNPAAAFNFINSLSPDQFASFANGSNLAFAAQPDGSTPQGIAYLQDKYCAMFLQDCAAAMADPNITPSQALQLIDRTYNAYSATSPQDPAEIPVIASALSTLLGNFYIAYFQQPPKFKYPTDGNVNQLTKNGEDLTQFIQDEIAGDKKAGYYAWGFGQWISTVDQTIGDDQVFTRQLAESVVASAALAAIPGVDVVAATVTIAAVEAAATGWALPQLDNMVFSPHTPSGQVSFYKRQTVNAMMRVATQLLAQGQLVYFDSSGQETIPEALANNHVSNGDALQWLLRNDANVGVIGTGLTLDEVMQSIESGYMKAEN